MSDLTCPICEIALVDPSDIECVEQIMLHCAMCGFKRNVPASFENAKHFDSLFESNAWPKKIPESILTTIRQEVMSFADTNRTNHTTPRDVIKIGRRYGRYWTFWEAKQIIQKFNL